MFQEFNKTKCKNNKCKNKKFLTAASVALLMASAPAFADSEGGVAQDQMPVHIQQEVEATTTLADSGEQPETFNQETDGHIVINVDAKETETADIAEIETIDQHMTATDLIGKTVRHENGDRIADIKDIILSSDGDAFLVVLENGNWAVEQEFIAFDFQTIVQTETEGSTITALSDDMLKNASPFSYDEKRHDILTKTIPQNGYSVATLLEGKLTNPDGKKVAGIDDISFKNGRTDRLVVRFGQILGLGGKQTTIAFDDTDFVYENGEARFKLSAAQAKQFETYKEIALN